MASDDLLTLRLRAGGSAPGFELKLAPSTTIAELKIEATAGCDIDPDAMRVIFKGKVLKDEMTLTSCGVADGDTLQLAKGSSASKPAAPAAAAAAAPAQAGGTSAEAPASSAETIRVTLKGLGSIEAELDLSSNDAVEDLRSLASKRCNLEASQIHLLLRGKFLKDGATLQTSGLKSGDTIHLARKQASNEGAQSATPTSPNTIEQEDRGASMPMAWGAGAGVPGMEDAMRHAAMAMGVTVEELRQALPPQPVMVNPHRPPAHETPEAMRARLQRDGGEMLRRVEAYLRSRREEEGGAEAIDEDDVTAILDEVAGVLRDARIRGAPVPNAADFVDRALVRRREQRLRQAHLDREAGDIDPELADALAAAEVAAGAAERWPRRLGHGDGGQSQGQGQGQGGGSS